MIPTLIVVKHRISAHSIIIHHTNTHTVIIHLVNVNVIIITENVSVYSSEVDIWSLGWTILWVLTLQYVVDVLGLPSDARDVCCVFVCVLNHCIHVFAGATVRGSNNAVGPSNVSGFTSDFAR